MATDAIYQGSGLLSGAQSSWNWRQSLVAGGLGFGVGQFMRVCFTGETPIRVRDGSIRADEVREGDKLLSQNEHDPEGEVEEKEVEEVFVRVSPVLNLHIGGKIIRTTGEHPFYVVDRGWIPAKILEAGDLLQAEDKRHLPVEGVADSGEIETVYNFRIAEYHTYFVGCAEWAFPGQFCKELLSACESL